MSLFFFIVKASLLILFLFLILTFSSYKNNNFQRYKTAWVEANANHFKLTQKYVIQQK